MPSASIQAWTVVRIGEVSTPPQSVTMPRNSPLSTNVILGALRTRAGREMSLVRGTTRAAGTWCEHGRHRCGRPRVFTGFRKGGTMPELSALRPVNEHPVNEHPVNVRPVNQRPVHVRLVNVPDAAPPYDCQVHGAQCPAPVGQTVAAMADVGPAGLAPPAALGPPAAGGPPAARAPPVARAPRWAAPLGVAVARGGAWPRRLAVVIVEV